MNSKALHETILSIAQQTGAKSQQLVSKVETYLKSDDFERHLDLAVGVLGSESELEKLGRGKRDLRVRRKLLFLGKQATYAAVAFVAIKSNTRAKGLLKAALAARAVIKKN